MMKLVVLALCLFVAAAFASPALEEDMAAESYAVPMSVPVEGASLPLGAARACTNSWCLSLCRRLGWPNGICLDRNTCFCWRR